MPNENDSNNKRTIMLELDREDVEALSGLIGHAATSGDPLAAMASRRLNAKLRPVLVAALPPEAREKVGEIIGEILDEDDVPDEVREAMEAMQSEITDGGALTEDEIARTDIGDEFAQFLAENDDLPQTG